LLRLVAAAVGVLGTMASVWWFALRPRRRAERGRGGPGGS